MASSARRLQFEWFEERDNLYTDPFRYEPEHQDELLWMEEMGLGPRTDEARLWGSRPQAEVLELDNPIIGSEEAA